MPISDTYMITIISGRLEHSVGNLNGAISYLRQGLTIAEQTMNRQDEARIRHRLGMALWQSQDPENAQIQLDRAASLFESIRREAKGTSDFKLSLFDLQTECYHLLQRVLVSLGREDEALVVAERGRTRAFVDLLIERQNNSNSNHSSKLQSKLDESTPSSVTEIVNLVNRQKASVIYYSIAAGYLHIWLIVPTKGIVKFHELQLNQVDSDGSNVLDENIQSVREALGISSTTTGHDNNEDEDMWGNHLDALGDKLNQEGDRTGFLRMVNRSSRLNASSYSLSSLFSVGSLGANSTISGLTVASSRHGSTRSRRNHWQGPSCLKKLYQLLLEPLEEEMPEGYPCEIMLVLEGDLYLVPFAMLKGPSDTEVLCEKYSLLVAPSLTSIKSARNKRNKNSEDGEKTSTLVVGNPKIPSGVSDQWGWSDISSSSQEASTVGEIMQSTPVTGDKATKDLVMEQMSQAECIHMACHVSWKLSALVLSPGDFVDAKSSPNAKRYSIHSDTIHESEEDMRSEVASTIDMPSLSDFLLTAADILNLKLRAKLVVLSTCYTKDEHGQVTSDGMISLTRALLAAGAQCVMVSLWPVPSTAVNLIMKALYSSMLQGARASKALAEAMTTVQNTKQLQHPTNWAGFVLVGSDVKLTNKVALMGQALRDILATPDSCRDALRVTLHLVEKSLQRIHRGSKNAMYTSQKSIETKVGIVKGWKDLLISVGFRFEPGTNGVPPSVFFPQSDPGERLTQCSASLQAILGLSATSWSALSKLLTSPEDADEIIALFRTVTVDLNSPSRDEMAASEVPVNVKLWRIPGCHELFASLGFDLMEVGKEDVILKSKTTNKRQIQFALQALLALFETQDAPRCINDVDDEESSFDEDCMDDSADTPDSVSSPENTPYPAPRKNGNLVFDTNSSAFSSYVRNRGEPDGRQAGLNDSPPAPAFPQSSIPPPPIPPIPPMVLQSQSQPNTTHHKGHESDCNFTPSPVDPIPKLSKPFFNGGSHNHNYHGGRRANHYGASPRLSDSSSSANSSFADWDTKPGSNLVRRPNMHASGIQSKLNQALNELSDLTSPRRPHVPAMPLYENSSMQYSARQPAGKPIVPIRSVFTDVGYAAMQKITDRSDPNDKFSVRTEVKPASHKSVSRQSSTSSSSNMTDSRLNPGVTKRIPPTGESDSPESTIQKRLSLSGVPNPETASITTTSSANTFIIKPDDQNGDSKNGTDLSEINIQDSIRTTQMRRMNRDPPAISEVYQERNMGLGLAPPLTSLLMSNNLQVVQVDHHSDSEGSAKNSSMNHSMTSQTGEESFSNFDNLTMIESAHKMPELGKVKSPADPPAKRRPPIPPKPNGNEHQGSTLPAWPHPKSMTRDDGDGRSMTDSQYSGYSPNGLHPVTANVGAHNSSNSSHHHHQDLSNKMNYLKLKDYMNDQEITVIEEAEDDKRPMSKSNNSEPTIIQTTIKPREIAKFINSEFKMPPAPVVNAVNAVVNEDPRKMGLHGNTKHPQQLWSRDKNGSLHYTGMFSSDC